MNRTQIALAVELRELIGSGGPFEHLTRAETSFVMNLLRHDRRKRLIPGQHRCLSDIGKRRLGNSHPAVVALLESP